MTANSDQFAARLESLTKKGSVREFARKCGMSEGAVRKYLTGKSEPTMGALLAMAREGGVSVQWLATGEDVPAAVPGVPETVTPYRLECADMPLEVDHPVAEFAAMAAEILKEYGFDADRRLEGWEAQALTWLRYIKDRDPELAKKLYNEIILGLARLSVRAARK